MVSAGSWNQNAQQNRAKQGVRVVVSCSPNGTIGSVWGSGPFTDDSSVCTAGVLAGVITVAKGGDVTIVPGPGQPTYLGSTANGVTSKDYGTYDGSFDIPADQKPT